MQLKESYIQLKSTPLKDCPKGIKQVSRGAFANEYGDKIEDYSQKKSPLTNRFISPYVTSETHGAHVFNWLVGFINEILGEKSTILDLGCGAGELLSKLKNKYECYGTTIHIGEVKYGREVYGLADICPMDMREITDYFEPDFFDCIIAHCSLHFITQGERQNLINNCVYSLLKPKGILIIVDYKNNPTTGVDNISSVYTDITPEDYNTMGTLKVLIK